MCRTIVGISANFCLVDEAGKNIHTSVSRKFVDGVRMGVGGLPMVIPVGDKSLVQDYVETIDKLILSGGQKCSPTVFMGRRRPSTVTTTILFEMSLSWHS